MVAIIWGGDNGSFFVPFGVLTFWRPFARFLFYRKHFSLFLDLSERLGRYVGNNHVFIAFALMNLNSEAQKI